MLVETKSGETFNGALESLDKHMNLKLIDVTRTSKDGTQFWKIPSVIIKGNSIKYINIGNNEVLTKAVETPDEKFNYSSRGKDYGRKNQDFSRKRGDSAPSRGAKRGGGRGGRP